VSAWDVAAAPDWAGLPPSWSEITLFVAAILLVLLWVVWSFASRLDRLHRKVAASRAALENQLVRRASVAGELASSGLLDPVSSVLMAEAAWVALSAGGYGRMELEAALPDLDLGSREGFPAATEQTDRDLAESELSWTVREVLGDPADVEALRAEPLGAELMSALVAAWYRVQLARRFHNEAVAQTQRVRRMALVRILRLHGHAPMSQTVEIDDAWPEPLRRLAESG
jgi:hypothetical protein